MIKLEFPSEEVIEEKIKNKNSFLLSEISGYEQLMKYCNLIESIIESYKMSCRVKTKGRTVVGIPFIFIPPGWVYYGSQIVHNIATFNPDWKITRNIITKRIEVKYCH